MGYHATGVAELGAAAGLQRGALHYQIKSKEDLRTIAERCDEVTVVIREMHALTGIRAKRLTLRDECENLFAEVLREGAKHAPVQLQGRRVRRLVLRRESQIMTWRGSRCSPA
jgi:AcrR family transcriptional regulator